MADCDASRNCPSMLKSLRRQRLRQQSSSSPTSTVLTSIRRQQIMSVFAEPWNVAPGRLHSIWVTGLKCEAETDLSSTSGRDRPACRVRIAQAGWAARHSGGRPPIVHVTGQFGTARSCTQPSPRSHRQAHRTARSADRDHDRGVGAVRSVLAHCQSAAARWWSCRCSSAGKRAIRKLC